MHDYWRTFSIGLAAAALLTGASCEQDTKPEAPTPDAAAPVVVITAPADSSLIAASDTIRIAATDDEGVVRVAAYVDGDSLGEDLIAPYAIPFDLGRLGADTLALSARAWDEAGNVGESPLITAFRPDAALVIESPVEGTIVSEVTPVLIGAIRPELVARTWLTVDGVALSDSGAPPFATDWDTEPWSDGGEHLLRAVGRAIDGSVMISPGIHVRVAPGADCAPLITEPIADSIQQSTITLRWTILENVTGYQVQFSFSNDFQPLAIDSTVYMHPVRTHLQGLGWLYIRVRGVFGGVNGPWSPSFRVWRGAALVDGICVAPEEGYGKAAAYGPDGRLMLVGVYNNQALMMGIDQNWEPFLFASPLLEANASAALGVREEGYGHWVLTIGFVDPYRTLLIVADDQGVPLSQVQILDRAFWESVGLLDLGGGASVTAVNTNLSTSIIRVDLPSTVVWSRTLYGEEDGGSGWYLFDRKNTEALLTRREGALLWAHSRMYTNTGHTGELFVLLHDLDPVTGEDLKTLQLPAIGLAGCCEVAGNQLFAVGIHKDRYPAAFLVSEGLDDYQFEAVDLGPVDDLDLRSMVALDSGDVVVAGMRADQALLFRMTTAGNIIWLHEYGVAGQNDVFNQVLLDPDGNLVVVGKVYDPDQYPHFALWVKRFDPAGNDITP